MPMTFDRSWLLFPFKYCSDPVTQIFFTSKHATHHIQPVPWLQSEALPVSWAEGHGWVRVEVEWCEKKWPTRGGFVNELMWFLRFPFMKIIADIAFFFQKTLGFKIWIISNLNTWNPGWLIKWVTRKWYLLLGFAKSRWIHPVLTNQWGLACGFAGCA